MNSSWLLLYTPACVIFKIKSLIFGHAYRANHLKESLENWLEDGVTNILQTFCDFKRNQDNDHGVMTKTPAMCNTMCNLRCIIEICDLKNCFHLSTGQTAKGNDETCNVYTNQSRITFKWLGRNRIKNNCNQCAIDIL